MPLHRFQIDLAIPDPMPNGLLQKPTQQELTYLGNFTWAEAIRIIIRRLRFYSQKINEGQPNEEDTTFNRYHLCPHDIDPHEPCVGEEI